MITRSTGCFSKGQKNWMYQYIHPKASSPDMIKPYLAYPGLSDAMWGYTAETGLHAIRLILSGLFDKYPNLKIILGHLGKSIPFWLWRMDKHSPRENTGISGTEPAIKLQRKIIEHYKENLYVTTSGMSGTR